MSVAWHSLSSTKIFQKLETTRFGLKGGDIGGRLKKYGRNELPRDKGYSKLKLFIGQFNSSLIFILLIATTISFFLKHYSDGIFILLVIFINTTVGFYQENKANNSLRALKKLVKIKARVLRDGNEKEIPSEELVPGDIIFLRAGDKIPADCYILEAKDVKANESSLTGEWLAESKEAGVLDENTPLADRTNILHMGTIMESGRAVAIVVLTGVQTEIGEVVSLISETHERLTPLQKKISSLSRAVGIFVILVTVAVVLIGLLSGRTAEEIFITALALAVSAIPAGILPAITIILVLGMRRILKNNGLVRKLIANETLGSVTVICTDKTGTLTEGKMEVSSILTGSRELVRDGKNEIASVKDSKDSESHIEALRIALLTSEAFIENPEDDLQEWIIRGTPTEKALVLASTHAGLVRRELERENPEIDRIDFNSEKKYSATLHQDKNNKKFLYVLGAPEALISKSIDISIDGANEKLTSEKFQKLLERLESLTLKGLRVVACAKRNIGPRKKYDKVEDLVEDLSLVGFIAMRDPLRKDSRESIELTQKAGIKTMIITGDHRKTAQAIAREIGIPSEDDRVIEGKDLDEISDLDLKKTVEHVTIYARVSPRHKVRLVKALQSNNEIVAMVGDGVNDAPALKSADVGISVGSGTDVAKEVSDIILLDNNFRTIVLAIEQGRVIFQNIRKVFVYLVADDFSQLFIFFGAILLGLPLPLLAAQILWINLVEDGLPDIAITTEQETAGVMDELPRPPDEPIMNKPIRWFMFMVFLVSGSAAFLTFLFGYYRIGDLELTRTIVFALMGLDSLFFAYSVRSFKKSVFRKDIFSNKFLVWATVISGIILVLSVYTPFLQKVLYTKPLSLEHWIAIVIISFVELIIIEFFKKIIFRPRPRLVLKKAGLGL